MIRTQWGDVPVEGIPLEEWHTKRHSRAYYYGQPRLWIDGVSSPSASPTAMPVGTDLQIDGHARWHGSMNRRPCPLARIFDVPVPRKLAAAGQRASETPHAPVHVYKHGDAAWPFESAFQALQHTVEAEPHVLRPGVPVD